MSGLSNSILRMCEGPLGVSNSNRNVGSVGEYVQQYVCDHNSYQLYYRTELYQGAYLQSKLAEGAKSFWLSQLVNCGSTEWRAKQPLIPADTYRVMSTWAFFSNEVSQPYPYAQHISFSYILPGTFRLESTL